VLDTGFFRFLTKELSMSQHELDSAVAQATGESVGTIRRRGFSIIEPDVVDFDHELNLLPAQVVDWDALEAQRRAA
jgi:hypothetical protein